MGKSEFYKSKCSYKKGTILYDELTQETFEVLNCIRIDFTENGCFGIEVKPIENLGVKNEEK